MNHSDLKAMLELYPNPKMPVAQIKKVLKDEYGTNKLTGATKSELLQRLRDAVGCKDIHTNEYYTFTSISCWKEDQEAMQATYDAQRRVWQAELSNDKENATLLHKAANERKELQEKKETLQKKRELWASSRTWAAKYNNQLSRAAIEAAWRKRYPKLSFAYSGNHMPEPHHFDDVMADYFTDKNRHAHHLLAYLEQGFGTFTFGGGYKPHHKYMTKEALKRIHGRQCMHLGTSHDFALEAVKRTVEQTATFRFKNGL